MNRLPLLMFVVAICLFQLVVFKKEKQIRRLIQLNYQLLTLCSNSTEAANLSSDTAERWRDQYWLLFSNSFPETRLQWNTNSERVTP